MGDKEQNRKKNHGASRREVFQAVAVLAAGAFVPYFIRRSGAQAADLGPYQSAKLNWRQAEGEKITVAVIPASYSRT
jgi:multiple sugar transport system substrate-binding protein